MSTKVFYTFYITKTPSQTGFGCRKSVENPVENRVESRPARHLRSQFGNGGLGVLTHRPSAAMRVLSRRSSPGAPVLTSHPRAPVLTSHLRRHAPPCVCSRCGPRSLRHVTREPVSASHLPSLRARLSASPARPGPGPRSCPDRPGGPWARASAPLPRILGPGVTSTLAGTMPRGRGRSGWFVAPAGAAPPAGVAT